MSPQNPILFLTNFLCGKVKTYHICISGSNRILMREKSYHRMRRKKNECVCIVNACGFLLFVGDFRKKNLFPRQIIVIMWNFPGFSFSFPCSGKTMIGLLFSTLSLTLHIYFFHSFGKLKPDPLLRWPIVRFANAIRWRCCENFWLKLYRINHTMKKKTSSYFSFGLSIIHCEKERDFCLYIQCEQEFEQARAICVASSDYIIHIYWSGNSHVLSVSFSPHCIINTMELASKPKLIVSQKRRKKNKTKIELFAVCCRVENQFQIENDVQFFFIVVYWSWCRNFFACET